MKSISKSTYTLVLVLLAQSLLWWGCANIVPPSGGDIDSTPPVLLNQSPKDSLLNQEVYKITLQFNKFMEVNNLERNLTMSPLLKTNPTVTSYGKRVVIKLPDSSLQANTTYRISLDNALTDNREKTPYSNFTFLFSTGSYFDSLSIKGKVWDAATGMPDTGATILLYAAGKNDSAVLSERPEYVGKVKSDGSFKVESLPDRTFKIFAVSDKDNNFIYSPEQEKIGFWDTVIRPSQPGDSMLKFYIFKEGEQTEDEGVQISKEDERENRFASKPKETKSTLIYKVNVDTNNIINGTFDLKNPLKIDLYKGIKNMDSSRVYLSYDDNGIEIESLHQLSVDSHQILIHNDWLPQKNYTLRLIKDWATDTSEATLPPGKFTFRTKALEDYATLNVNMDSSYISDEYLLVLLKGGETVFKQAATTRSIHIPLLTPGSYTMRLVVDKNKNGKWDSGDFLKKQHPEKVIPYSGQVSLKAGWINDVDFKKVEAPKKLSKEERFDQ